MIAAYGFDRAGFSIPPNAIPIDDVTIVKFVPFLNGERLDSYDGVIIPQGIFEEIIRHIGAFKTYYEVNCNRDVLLDREKQILNLLERGGWVCFLVSNIIDFIPSSTGGRRDIMDTDLCKVALNGFTIGRKNIIGTPLIECKVPEFREFVDKYGVAKTYFVLPKGDKKDKKIVFRIIATTSDKAIVGFEISQKLFFLPFHSASKDRDNSVIIASTVTQAITEYRKRCIVEIPDWAKQFQFDQEKKLKKEIESLHLYMNTLQDSLTIWREYKAILITSGEILKDGILAILEDFFQMKVDPTDEHREDAKIIDEEGNILAIIEIKGTNSGVRREHINQVDSHRERSDLMPNIPGILFINNEMSVAGINERLNTKVARDHIKHAQKSNITIIRTIDLLFLMKHLENESNRKEKFMNLIKSGGGWLRADFEGYTVIQDSNN